MKPDKIIFVDKDLEREFNELSEKDPTRKALVKAIKSIQEDVHCGRNVKKKLIPKELIRKYNISNLWIYNLPSSWRLIYSLTSFGDIKIIAAILNWMNHKDYERLFNF